MERPSYLRLRLSGKLNIEIFMISSSTHVDVKITYFHINVKIMYVFLFNIIVHITYILVNQCTELTKIFIYLSQLNQSL